MIEVREATGPESGTWQEGWRRRLQAWYGRYDVTPDWTGHHVQRRVAEYRNAAQGSAFAVTSGRETVGILALVLVHDSGPPRAAVADLWIAAPHRRRGHGSAALRWAENWAGSRAGSLWVSLDPADRAQAALFGGYPVRSQVMIKRLDRADALSDGLEARPMSEARFLAFRSDVIRGYAADIADSGTLPADAAAVRAATEFDQTLPGGLTTANHAFLCLHAGAEVVATNWVCHHREPGASWVYGVEVSEPHRGQGYGRAAMIAGEQAALAAGDTHLALNVFGSNAAAISLYERMAYQAVEESRSIDL